MYTFQSRVRYSELDPERKLSIASIVDYFQDCSTFHSEQLGGGGLTIWKRGTCYG